MQSTSSAACSKASTVHMAPSLTDVCDQREGIAAVPESCFEAAHPTPTCHDPVGVRHLNVLQVNKKGLRFSCWMFRSATLKAVRIHLDSFMDMASQETPFPPVHSSLQILSTESADAELGLLLMKCSFRSAAALLTNSHIYLRSLCEDLARGRSGGRICLMGLGLLTAACQNL